MTDEHLSPGGGRVVACASDESCKMVSCEVCLSEVPADAALTADVQDYVHYFCGLDCLEAWQRQARKTP
jgi:uncharacterized ParB-like nuclease family protein